MALERLWISGGFRRQLVDGTQVNSPSTLREALTARPEAFITTFSSKLLTYALGRGIDYYDMPVVRLIDRDATRHENRFSAFVLGIVKSTPFQMRRTELPEAAPIETEKGN